MLMIQEKNEESTDRINMALIAHDADRWIPTLFDIPLHEMISSTHSVDDFMKDGEVDFGDSIIKYDYSPSLNPEETISKLREMLDDKTMSLTSDAGPFWKAE
jgi:hypothetical protein